MKSHWVFFFCFHLTKINVYCLVLEKIPEEWKKYPKPVPTNYHKPSDNFLNAYVSNYKLPIITSQVKTQYAEPEINMSFSLPQNQQILPNLLTPQIVTQLENIDNMIDEKNPNIQIKPIDILSKNNEDDKVLCENIKFEDQNETYSKHHNEQTELKRTEELNINTMNNNTFNEKVKTIKDINVNSSVYSDDSILLDFLNQENKEADVHIKEENNKSTPHKEKNKKFKEVGPIKYIVLAANKILPYHIDKEDDESKGRNEELKRTSDIEIVINDPDTNVILYRQDNIKTAPTLKEFPNMNNENENSNIDSSSQRSAQDNGMFVTQQYTNSISNADNYANVYQIGANTKKDRCDDKYETFTISDEANKIPNSNDQKICRSLRNTDLVIRNNPRKIKLYINYRRPKNKLYFHKDYNNHNNFKLYYLRC